MNIKRLTKLYKDINLKILYKGIYFLLDERQRIAPAFNDNVQVNYLSSHQWYNLTIYSKQKV